MSSRLCVYVVLLRILLASQLLNYAFAYIEYTVENERVCSPLAKKRKVKLGYDERSALALQETRYFNHWPGTYDFNCHFEIEAISKDGLAVVIQNLNLRKNETTGECIDYIQLTPEHGPPSEKLCGVMSTPVPGSVTAEDVASVASNAYIDVKGELGVSIYVKKQPLKYHEKIDIDIVFTAFKLCAKNPMNYLSCGKEICVWEGFFKDGRVNCPFSDCSDEQSCTVSFNGVLTKESSPSPWYALLILFCMLVLGFCLYFVFRKRRSSRHQHRPQQEEASLAPSAPPMAESPKDKPPPYDSLFPSE